MIILPYDHLKSSEHQNVFWVENHDNYVFANDCNKWD